MFVPPTAPAGDPNIRDGRSRCCTAFAEERLRDLPDVEAIIQQCEPKIITANPHADNAELAIGGMTLFATTWHGLAILWLSNIRDDPKASYRDWPTLHAVLRTVDDLVKNGKLKSVRFGERRLFRPVDRDEFVASLA